MALPFASPPVTQRPPNSSGGAADDIKDYPTRMLHLVAKLSEWRDTFKTKNDREPKATDFAECHLIAQDYLQYNTLRARHQMYGARRRVLLWHEFLYNCFKKDFDLVKTYFIMDPSRRFDVTPDDMWLLALSIHHSHTIEQSLGNVEIEDASDTDDDEHSDQAPSPPTTPTHDY